MKKPLIGIAANRLINTGGMFPGMERAYVNNNYVTSILKAGGVPVMLPVIEDREDIMAQTEGLDGVLLTGGYDVDPALYGEEIRNECGEIMPVTDRFNIAVVKAAAERKIPVFGICKGIQIINVAFGGTLYQDQTVQVQGSLRHVQNAPRYEGTHEITTQEGSFLRSILGEKIRVNSFHHQSVKDVAEGFAVTARANDGIVEGIERKEGSFITGVQFHPEMMAEYDNETMIALFHGFMEKCAKEAE
jgi:putative glutamine amidotransferase